MVHILFGLPDHDDGAISITTWRRVSMQQLNSELWPLTSLTKCRLTVTAVAPLYCSRETHGGKCQTMFVRLNNGYVADVAATELCCFHFCVSLSVSLLQVTPWIISWTKISSWLYRTLPSQYTRHWAWLCIRLWQDCWRRCHMTSCSLRTTEQESVHGNRCQYMTVHLNTRQHMSVHISISHYMSIDVNTLQRTSIQVNRCQQT